MNNEIQLSSLGQSLPMQPAAPGGALGGYYGAPAAAPKEENPLHKIHRLLRGRYLLAFGLGLAGAVAGAAGGYLSQKPAYKAEALIEVRPVDIRSGSQRGSDQGDKILPLMSAFVNSQIATIGSDKLIREAIKDPKFQAVRKCEATDGEVSKFGDNLTVALQPKSNTIISVSYSEPGKESQVVASAAVQSLIAAFKKQFDRDDKVKAAASKRKEYWEGEADSLNRRIIALRQLIQEDSKTTDGDPAALRKYEDSLAQHEMDRDNLERSLKLARTAKEELDKGLRRKPTPEDWGRVDPTMTKRIQMRDDLQRVVSALVAQLGPAHKAVLDRKDELAVVKAEIDSYAKELESKYLFVWKPDGTGGTLLSNDMRSLEQSIKDLTAQVAEERVRVEKIRQAADRITYSKQQIDQLNARYSDAQEAAREWKFRAENQLLLEYKSDGSIARLDKDRRPIFAAIGFMGGAGLPIGLLLLFGLFDTRYRYSDETSASGQSVGGLTLLGILPNLPDRLSDPEQAAIAAHCVHQIRTMLQINTGLEDRRVFAVTSASPGDGKTSLTLALGLSYAACGTRTLLIDCDLVGSGLSSRMNASNAAEGVLEAIANRSLMPYVRQTDVNDVSILPVGTSGSMHASTLSPQALRRLIQEAEQHFEVVLIDTGPILGSIEASLVCAAADAVILTVSRGQQRPMVERSLGHLAAIGARLAGVVFNRAQAQDFERSISGVSMRSVGIAGMPRGNRPAGPRLGPVARAVQTDAEANGPETPPTE